MRVQWYEGSETSFSEWNEPPMTKLTFQEVLLEVWRQTLVENAKSVTLGAESYPVRRTPKRGLAQVDFVFDGNEIRGIEQNCCQPGS